MLPRASESKNARASGVPIGGVKVLPTPEASVSTSTSSAPLTAEDSPNCPPAVPSQAHKPPISELLERGVASRSNLGRPQTKKPANAFASHASGGCRGSEFGGMLHEVARLRERSVRRADIRKTSVCTWGEMQIDLWLQKYCSLRVGDFTLARFKEVLGLEGAQLGASDLAELDSAIFFGSPGVEFLFPMQLEYFKDVYSRDECLDVHFAEFVAAFVRAMVKVRINATGDRWRMLKVLFSMTHD